MKGGKAVIALSKSAARYIGKLSNKIRRKIDASSSHGELSGAQGKALHFILAQTNNVFQKDIEEEFGLRPPTATELLKKMERDGLIRREAVSYDARLKRIIATEKALRYKEQVISDLENLENELTRGIDAGDLKVFFRVMDKMFGNLS